MFESKIFFTYTLLKFLKTPNKSFEKYGLQFLKQEIDNYDFEVEGSKVTISSDPYHKEIKVGLNSVYVYSETEFGTCKKEFINCLGDLNELKKLDGVFIHEISQSHEGVFEKFFVNYLGETFELLTGFEDSKSKDEILKLGEKCSKKVIINLFEHCLV